MFESKKTPGKKFGSAFAGRSYDERHQGGESEPAGVEDSAKEEQNEGAQEAAAEVVKQHGKATSVHVTHDHKNKKHHVTSTHEDGHVNHSDHESAAQAHEEGGALAGEDVKKEHPEEAQQGAQSETDGFQMPDLA